MKRVILFFALALSGLGAANAQWSDDPATNLQLTDQNSYTFETELLSDGSWYFYYNRPDGSIDTIVPYLQRYDKDGNALWEETLAVSRQLTNSWTKVMAWTGDIHGLQNYAGWNIGVGGRCRLAFGCLSGWLCGLEHGADCRWQLHLRLAGIYKR